MGLSVEIGKKLDNNCVEVTVNSPKCPTRFFKVPENKADEFCKQYKNNDSNSGFITAGVITGTAIASCSIANILAKNLSKIYRNGIGVLVGIASVLAATVATAPLAVKREEQVLKQFNAIEIEHNRKEFPI